MPAQRRTDPERRRSQLIAAARHVFAAKGVAGALVSDIVRAAGVAQGTFYLYFPAKDDIVDAVVEQITVGMVEAMEQAVAAHAGAVAKLDAILQCVLSIGSDPTGRELAQVYHRPENRAMHDRTAERYTVRLVPLIEEIVRQGVAEGAFTTAHPQIAAWFVLGGFHALELALSRPGGAVMAVAGVRECALRALGYDMPGDSDAPDSEREV